MRYFLHHLEKFATSSEHHIDNHAQNSGSCPLAHYYLHDLEQQMKHQDYCFIKLPGLLSSTEQLFRWDCWNSVSTRGNCYPFSFSPFLVILTELSFIAIKNILLLNFQACFWALNNFFDGIVGIRLVQEVTVMHFAGLLSSTGRLLGILLVQELRLPVASLQNAKHFLVWFANQSYHFYPA